MSLRKKEKARSQWLRTILRSQTFVILVLLCKKSPEWVIIDNENTRKTIVHYTCHVSLVMLHLSCFT